MNGKKHIEDRLIKVATIMDRPPVSVILFAAVCIGIMIACGAAYNSVVPAYQ